MTSWEWFLIVAALVLNLGGSIFCARLSARYRDAGRAAWAEAADANRQINEAMTLFTYGARDEAFEIMRKLEEKNKRFIAELQGR